MSHFEIHTGRYEVSEHNESKGRWSWMDGWMGGWMDGWMDGWVGGWVDGWTDGWMDGWMEVDNSLKPRQL